MEAYMGLTRIQMNYLGLQLQQWHQEINSQGI